MVGGPDYRYQRRPFAMKAATKAIEQAAFGWRMLDAHQWDELVAQLLQGPPPQTLCPLYGQGTSVVAVACQGAMVTYRCVDGLCFVAAAIANNGTSWSTRQGVIEAALATMAPCLLYTAQ